MADLPAQGSPDAQGRHLVLYDGVCGLCNRLLQFLLRHDQRAVFAFASLQSAAGRAVVEQTGGDPDDLTSFYVVADFQSPHPRVFVKSDAAVFVASQLGWPWRALRVADVLPRVLRNGVYDVIARTRYQIFGRYEQCLMPREEYRSRFVE